MRLTFMGTGTSHGIPVIGCDCDVCRSDDRKNKRTRASVLVETGGLSILIDTATEFRLQAVREGIKNIDFVFYTHSHADHIHGLDDLRPLTREKPIPLYGSAETIKDLKNRFSYIMDGPVTGGGKPRVTFNEIQGDIPVELADREGNIVRIVPVPVKHGDLDIFGYRIGRLAYITDCSHIPESSMKKLEGIDTLIIGALRYRPHPTHFSVDEAAAVAGKLSCRTAWLTHMCHNIDHNEVGKYLPENVKPAFDGLRIEVIDSQ